MGRPIARTPEWENQVKFTDGMIKLMGRNYTLYPEDLISLEWWGNSICSARNTIFKAALERDSDYVIFFDDDMTVYDLADDVEQMINLDKDIVAAIGVTKGRPHMPNINKILRIGESRTVCDSHSYRIYEYPKDKPFQVDGAGTGFMCIKKHVLQKMPAPWFYMPPCYLDGNIKGEDFTFCFNAKMHGFQVWIDPTIRCGHLGSFAYGPDYTATSFATFKDELIKDANKTREDYIGKHGAMNITNCDCTHNLVPEVQEQFKKAEGPKRMFV